MMSVRKFKKPVDRTKTDFDSISSFLESKSLEYKEVNDHYQLNCFICDETRQRLGIVKDGVEGAGKWKCFNCNSRGTTLKTLLYAFNHKGQVNQKKIREESGAKKKKSTIDPQLHKSFHELAKSKKKTLLSYKYATEDRKLSPQAFEHFQLGSRSVFQTKLGEDKQKFEHLAIPYLVDGKCVNLKYRSLDPEVDKKWKWLREKGGETVLFNHDVIYDLDYDSIIIAEGEIDCMSVWSMGYENVIGMTAGADAFQDLWYEQLKRYNKVYLLLDRDEAGQRGARTIAGRLGLDKCFNVTLPDDVKDANDFLIKYKPTDFNTLLRGARQFQVPNVLSLKDGINSIISNRNLPEEDNSSGYDTPWPTLNDKVGKIRGGHLVVLVARPKTGKSTLAMNWMLYLAHKGVPTGMYTCEMSVKDISYRMSQIEVPSLPRDEKDADIIDLKEARYRLPGDKLQFYYPQIGDLELEKVEDKIREMVQRYGIKVFFFDNLHFLCRGEDEKAMIDKTTQTFKILAATLDIVIVIIAHPRKGSDGKNLSNDDLKGSSSIFQDADSVLLLNRRLDIEDDVNEEQAELALSKTMIQVTARFAEGGRTTLAFNGARGRFTDRGPLYMRVKAFMKEAGRAKGKKK